MTKSNIMDIERQTIRIVTSPSPDAVNTFFYAKEVGFIEAPKDFSIEFAPMESYLFLLVTEGRLRFQQGDAERILERNEIAFVDCTTQHRYVAGLDDKCAFLYVYFNGRQVKEYYKLVSGEDSLPVFSMEDPERVIALMWQIVNLHEKKSYNTEPLVSLNITKILTEMFLSRSEGVESDNSHPGFINVAYHYIGHHFKEKVTLDILARECGVNKFYLAREFKKYSGETINEYLVTTRINKAKKLLRFTDMKIESIAMEVGFYGASHFIKVFKSREHCTPFYYRKQSK